MLLGSCGRCMARTETTVTVYRPSVWYKLERFKAENMCVCVCVCVCQDMCVCFIGQPSIGYWVGPHDVCRRLLASMLMLKSCISPGSSWLPLKGLTFSLINFIHLTGHAASNQCTSLQAFAFNHNYCLDEQCLSTIKSLEKTTQLVALVTPEFYGRTANTAPKVWISSLHYDSVDETLDLFNANMQRDIANGLVTLKQAR